MLLSFSITFVLPGSPTSRSFATGFTTKKTPSEVQLFKNLSSSPETLPEDETSSTPFSTTIKPPPGSYERGFETFEEMLRTFKAECQVYSDTFKIKIPDN